MHWLSAILWTPALGALIVGCLPAQRPAWIRCIAFAHSLATLGWAMALLFRFDRHVSGVQFVEFAPWNPSLGEAYALGVDGLALPMVILTPVLVCAALMASAGIERRVKSYHLWMLTLETAILGVFLAQDWVLFYLFWELTLIPLFFLIDQWGGERRQTASLNFVLYTMGGSVFMLISLLLIYQHGLDHSTTFTAMLRAAANLPAERQLLVFLGFVVGFGVKLPVFPLHGWLPLAHVEAPSPVSILLSGILLKMGAYGLIRAVDLLPSAALVCQPLLAGLGALGILYGGLLAWRQTDLKAMIAYSSVSHMGVVLLGIAALNPLGLLGAAYQMVAHGFVAGALFLLIGLLYQRTHTRELGDYSSLVHVTPGFAVCTSLALLGALSMPGSAGFVAELFALVGGWQRWGGAVVAMSVGVLVSAAYAFRTMAQLFTGPVRPAMATVQDLTPTEWTAATVMVGGIVTLGVFPAPLVDLLDSATESLAARLAHF